MKIQQRFHQNVVRGEEYYLDKMYIVTTQYSNVGTTLKLNEMID
jgi:hypothetical protein